MAFSNDTCVVLYGNDKILLDNFRCFLANSSEFLNRINFGYICIPFLLILMLISIFGGIKENYRWHILNQVIWDLIISYRFICFNWMAYAFSGTGGSSCFFEITSGIFKSMFAFSIDTNSYSPLLLISFMRVLCLYFPNFYERLTHRWRTLYIILIFNFIVVITTVNSIFDNLYKQRRDFLIQLCQIETNEATISQCSQIYVNDFQCWVFQAVSVVLSCITFFKPIFCLLGSLVSSIFIIIKAAHPIKLDKSKNQKKSKSSYRICAAISLQTILNLFIFSFETIKNIPTFVGSTLQNKTVFSTFILPSWINGAYGLANYGVLQAFTQIRIFVECLIIFILMKGYRESFIKFLKHLKRYLIEHIGNKTAVVPLVNGKTSAFFQREPVRNKNAVVPSNY